MTAGLPVEGEASEEQTIGRHFVRRLFRGRRKRGAATESTRSMTGQLGSCRMHPLWQSSIRGSKASTASARLGLEFGEGGDHTGDVRRIGAHA